MYQTDFNVSNIPNNFQMYLKFIKMILFSLATSKATIVDQVAAKFLRDGAEVLCLFWRNKVNLSVKL